MSSELLGGASSIGPDRIMQDRGALEAAQPSTLSDSRQAEQAEGSHLPLRVWLALLATGIGAGLTSGVLMRLLRLVEHLSFHYNSGVFLAGVEGVSGLRRVVVLLCAGLLAGVVLFAVQKIKDHDGPELNDAVRDYSGDLPEQSMAVRAVLSIVYVGMGAAIGREAALKQIGGIVGKRVSVLAGLTPAQRKLIVACGVGAGMAAAYNVPFGGALFTLEVLLDTVSPAAALAAITTSFLATWVSWLMLPNLPSYGIPELRTTVPLLLWAIVAGPILGLASIAFARGIHWGKEHAPQGWRIVALPVLVFGLLGLLSIPFPELLGNGRSVIQEAFDLKMTVSLLLWLIILRPLATIFVLRSGAPGGLFTPTMTLGTVAGAVLGLPLAGYAAATDPRCYAVVGAGAVLAAATQAPLSSIAFTLELTAHTGGIIVPLLIAVCGAALTFRRLGGRPTG